MISIRRQMRIVLAALVMLVAVTTAQRADGDKLILKNKREVVGTIVEETDSKVSIVTPLGRWSFPRYRIEKIIRQNAIETQLELGKSYLKQKALNRAVEHLEAARRADGDHPEIRTTLAQAYAAKAQKLFKARWYGSARAYAIQSNDTESADAMKSLIAKIDGKLAEAEKKIEAIHKLVAAHKLDETRLKFYDLFNAFPARRESLGSEIASVLIGIGDRYFTDERFAFAADSYQEAVSFDPKVLGKLEGKLVFGRITHINDILGSGQTEEAVRLMADLLQVVPQSGIVNYYYGVLLEATREDPRDAAEYYAAAAGIPVQRKVDAKQLVQLKRAAQKQLKIDPGKEKVAAKLEEAKWEKVESKDLLAYESIYLKIHHRNRRLAAEVGRVGDRNLAQIAALWPPLNGKGGPGKIHVYIYRDAVEYSKVTGQPGWSGGVNKVSFIGAAIAQREIHTFQTANAVLDSILPHELTHVVFTEAVGGRARVPRWLSEGVAVLEEPPFKTRYYENLVRTRVKAGGHIPLSKLFAMTDYPNEEAIRLFYGESHSVVKFLIARYGRPALVRYCQQLGGKEAKTALQDVFGYREPADLEAVWKQTL